MPNVQSVRALSFKQSSFPDCPGKLSLPARPVSYMLTPNPGGNKLSCQSREEETSWPVVCFNCPVSMQTSRLGMHVVPTRCLSENYISRILSSQALRPDEV